MSSIPMINIACMNRLSAARDLPIFVQVGEGQDGIDALNTCEFLIFNPHTYTNTPNHRR